MADKYGTLDRLAEEIRQANLKEYERKRQMSQINYPTNSPLYPSTNPLSRTPYPPEKNAVNVYSLAEVQLTGGRMIGMTISAGPAIAKHLMDTMKSTGYLHMFNDVEALMIRSDEVVAIKLTKLTTE